MSSNTTSSTASCDRAVTVGGRPVRVVRSARARRVRLALDHLGLRLTVPRRAALGPALAWAERQAGWIEAALAKRPAPAPLADGQVLPFEGRELRIRWTGDTRRVVQVEGDRLLVGGPADMIAARLSRWLRGQARIRLEAETRALAALHGIAVGRVRVGDARTRWGSCSSAGDIAYSWRLVLAPPEVLRATVAHELAHRLHMDHSPAFHAAVARLFGRAPDRERAWLRAHGAALQAIGR